MAVLDRLVKASEAAKRLAVSGEQLRRMVEAGEIGAVQNRKGQGGRRGKRGSNIFIPEAEITRWIRERYTPPRGTRKARPRGARMGRVAGAAR